MFWLLLENQYQFIVILSEKPLLINRDSHQRLPLKIPVVAIVL